MMNQRTLAGCGLEAVVPVAALSDDPILCSDDTVLLHKDVFYDCKGGAHSNDTDQKESNVEIVTDLLTKMDEGICEYATENDYYTSGYDVIVDDSSWSWKGPVKEWLVENFGNHYGTSKFDDHVGLMDEVVSAICEVLNGSMDCDCEYQSNEYAAYSGSGCCLGSFEIGDVEEQLDLAEFPELQTLHDAGILNDILDDVNCAVYVSRSKRRVKRDERWTYVGRETYMPYAHDENHPMLTTIHSPGGQWHFVVSKDLMVEAYNAAIVNVARGWV